MARKRILPKHPVEGGVDLVLGNFPRHQGTLSQVCRKQRLTDASDRSCAQHRGDPCHTTSTPIPERFAISSNGSRTNPSISSSETARTFALTGSLCSTG